MSAKKNITLIILNISVSVLVMSILSIYVLPPIIQELNSSNEHTGGDTDAGIVLQSKYEIYDERASIADTDNESYMLMPGTSMLITIQDQSRISAVFSGYCYLAITSMDAGYRLQYNVSLNIEGVGNRVTYVRYQTTTFNVLTEQYSINMYIDYVTTPLSAGTYNVSVMWVSQNDHDGLSYLTFNWDPDEPLRSLWVQELA